MKDDFFMGLTTIMVVVVVVVFAAAWWDGSNSMKRAERLAEQGCVLVSTEQTGRTRLEAGKFWKKETVLSYQCDSGKKLVVQWR